MDFDAGGFCCVLICVSVSCVAAIWLALLKLSGLLVTGESLSPKPLEVALAADGWEFSSGEDGAACFWERSTGLAISSNEELSPSDSASSSLSSVNFEARSLIEAVCWFMDGGGPRREDAGGAGSGSGEGDFFIGEGGLGDGARAAGIESEGTSVGSSPA